MNQGMSTDELIALVRRVFAPGPGERGLAVLVDLPDAQVPDHAEWRERRDLAAAWVEALAGRREELGFPVRLVVYPNVHTNNGDLPARAWIHGGGPVPQVAGDLDPAASVPFPGIYAGHSILIALTTFSATAPLKVAARLHPIRAATMPGFTAAMLPSLRLDYQEVNRRVELLKGLLDRASGADLRFRHPGGEARLHLDLRHRAAHASGGLLPRPGTAGNLPSGEAYIVPYEGELEGAPSRSEGTLPVQFGAEVVCYDIRGNVAVGVAPGGAEAAREAALLAAEPAYGNLAELGLGVLAAFGVKPVGTVLLDEKLGLHIAFGRSEHFGGQVGPDAFSRPEAVVHIDRVYVPETQPDVAVAEVTLEMEDGPAFPLMCEGEYVEGLFRR
ncbi:M29 family metallopeptidase [Mesoterricola silvestris]|uniref:Uncharacterized protein n=1 Tax=Mesoterricola silvestris TaxID=2927979 RepID=A0AA48GKG5_9BACT|nr:hypothetical protein [Mesoterricola silvestris]BDU71414.1 hypothetical protein METEAL_05880 [Mesoterricola silvestris]